MSRSCSGRPDEQVEVVVALGLSEDLEAGVVQPLTYPLGVRVVVVTLVDQLAGDRAGVERLGQRLVGQLNGEVRRGTGSQQLLESADHGRPVFRPHVFQRVNAQHRVGGAVEVGLVGKVLHVEHSGFHLRVRTG
jgi:hypothetical protein